MIVSTFKSGTSFGHAVREYLLQKDRTVAPRLLRGDINLIVDLIDSIHRKWKYTSGALRFHKDDQPTPAQLDEIMDSFEEFMFAGKARESFDLVWVEHLDKSDQEIHFVIPRIDLETHQDLNIAPPGYADQHKVWAEKINLFYGFKSPLKARARSKPKQEAHSRKTKRASVYEEMTRKYEAGVIRSRTDLLAELNKLGTVRSKNPNTKFISVKFEGLENNIRFDGGIFARDFDFAKDQPSQTQRHSRTMADYTEAAPVKTRASHRFEHPIADPFGNQNAYRRDVEERYEAAFTYRKERFEMIRAKSRRLKALAEKGQTGDVNPPRPDRTNKSRESIEDVERVREARRRTRNRKSRIAELSRKATNSAGACGRALSRIRGHLRRALDHCLEALKRKSDPDFFEQDRARWNKSVRDVSGVDRWTTKLGTLLVKIEDPPAGHLSAVYIHIARKLIESKESLLTSVESALDQVPRVHRAQIAANIREVVDASIKNAQDRHPRLKSDQTHRETHNPTRPKTSKPSSGLDI